MTHPEISIVIPVFGGKESLYQLYQRLNESLSVITTSFEIIMINDASPDNAWQVISNLAEKDNRVKGINLSRNFGQHYAITAGLDYAQGDWVVVMDCDLQDQPEEIIHLYNKAQEGFDLVLASRKNRKDSFLKRLGSKLFYQLLSYLTDTEQDGSIANFGIYHRKVIHAVLSMGDEIKYFPVMVRWVGFKCRVLNIKHARRHEGKSSYTLQGLMKLAISIMISFSDKPLTLMVKLGGSISIISFLYSVYVFFNVFFNGVFVSGWASIMISIWFLGGLIIMLLGVSGIYIGKIFDQTKSRPAYIIKEMT